MKSLMCLLFLAAGLVPMPVLGGDEVAAFLADNTHKRRNPALSDDLTFLRRVYLDITGRLPDDTTMNQFPLSGDPDKRAALIDELLASQAYVDRWTTFFTNLYKNQRLVEQAFFRNSFHQLVRNAVAENQPMDALAREILVGDGRGAAPESSFFFWAREAIDEDFRLDYLDDQVSFITETMLGVRTDCISCHDGAYHLEDVNKDLSTRTRGDFWGMAAFLSQSYLYVAPYQEDETQSEDVQFFQNLHLVDTDDPTFDEGEGYLFAEEPFTDGQYHALSESGQGMRPPRNGGTISPAYLFSGEGPRPGETRRRALARILTADRQFARNLVNRVWAHFLGEGFVEPLHAWDLARLNETTAGAHNTTVQARTPELMEYLTSWFIARDYDLKALIRLITGSELYQWDYQNRGDELIGSFSVWGGEKRVRRLEAEALVDGMRDVLGQSFWKYMVSGKLEQTFNSTWQMPDAVEPLPEAIFDPENYETPLIDVTELGYGSLDEYFFMQYVTMDILALLGRSDPLLDRPRKSESNVPLVLALLNNSDFAFWLEEWQYAPTIALLADQIENNQISQEIAATRLFRRILFRQPNPTELNLLSAQFQGREAGRALADIAWALFNHPDFLYR